MNCSVCKDRRSVSVEGYSSTIACPNCLGFVDYDGNVHIVMSDSMIGDSWGESGSVLDPDSSWNTLSEARANLASILELNIIGEK